MFRTMTCLLAIVAASVVTPAISAGEITGFYMETRTCQVYTGPCFANAEVGLSGKNAIMAWSVKNGDRDGVDLAGLNVVVVVKANATLGFAGLNTPSEIRSVILVDDRATDAQREALVGFAKEQVGPAAEDVAAIDSVAISMKLEPSVVKGELTAGTVVTMTTRAARPGDCICSNESAYYPPLAKVENFAPGVTLEGQFSGRGLGTTWSTPGDRSAYMATFRY